MFARILFLLLILIFPSHITAAGCGAGKGNAWGGGDQWSSGGGTCYNGDAAPAAGSRILLIDDDGLDCPTANFSSVDAAMYWVANDNALQDNFKLELCNGTYEENIVIESTNFWKFDLGLEIYSVSGNSADVILTASSGKAFESQSTGAYLDFKLKNLTIECNGTCTDAFYSTSKFKGLTLENVKITSTGTGFYTAAIYSDTTAGRDIFITDVNITSVGTALNFADFDDILYMTNSSFETSAGTYAAYLGGTAGSGVIADMNESIFRNSAAGGSGLVTSKNWSVNNIEHNCFEAAVPITNNLQNTTNAYFDRNYWSDHGCTDDGSGFCVEVPYTISSGIADTDLHPVVTCGGGGASLPEPTTKHIIVDDDGVECSNRNFASITSALSWIDTSSTLGDDYYTLEVCSGTYNEGNLIGTSTKYDANLTIYSSTENPSDVIINNDGDATVFDFGGTSYGLELRGLTLNCSGGACTSAIKHSTGWAKGFKFDNLIINSAAIGIELPVNVFNDVAADTYIKNSVINSASHGIYAVDTDDDILISNNTITVTSGYGIYFGPLSTSNRIEIAGSIITAPSDAIYSEMTNGIVITSSSITSTGGRGVYAQHSTGGALIEFSDTNITASGHGIHTYKMNTPEYSDLRVTSTGGSALYVEHGNGGAVTTRDCIFTSPQDGIFANAAANSFFERTTVVSTAGHGIHMDTGNNGKLYLSDINVQAALDGIRTSDSGSTGKGYYIESNVSTLTKNIITAGQKGIYANALAGIFKIYDMNITATGDGIWFNNTSHGSILENNIISSGGDYGVNYYSGYGNNAVIRANIITNTNPAGLVLATLDWDGANWASSEVITGNCFYGDVDNRLNATSTIFDASGSGNYWSDAAGTGGYSNTCTDGDSNGICDAAYQVPRVTFPAYPADYDYNPLTECNISFGGGGGEGNATIYSFDAWESVKSIADRKVFTKILNETNASVVIASLNEAGDALENYDGIVKARAVKSTTCPSGDDSLSAWASVDMTGISTAQPNITYTSVSQDARIQIEDKDGNRSCSTDNFAIRPNRFSIEVRKKSDATLLDNDLTTDTPVQAAGGDLNITVRALDFGSNPSTGFDEAFTVTASVDDVASVFLGTLGNATQTFLNGQKSFDSNYSEAGVVDINISADSLYAAVDNADGSDYIIKAAGQRTGRFIPDDFNISTALLSMTSQAKSVNPADCNYTYLSQDLDYNLTATFEVNITAVNVLGTVTRNYDLATYAKNADLNLTFEYDVSGVTYEARIADAMQNTDFSAGFANLDENATFNIVAPNGRKTPQNPVAFTTGDITQITALDINDTDNVMENAANVVLPRVVGGPAGEGIYLLYGRLNPIDAVSDTGLDANVSIYYEVYGTDRAAVARAFNVNAADLNESVNDVNWWRNPRHQVCDGFDAGDFTWSLPAGVANVSITPNTDRDIAIYSFAGARPTKSRLDINMNDSFGFLYHHPYSDNFIKSFYIDFIDAPPAAAAGDVIQNEGSGTKSSSRIGE